MSKISINLCGLLGLLVAHELISEDEANYINERVSKGETEHTLADDIEGFRILKESYKDE